MHPFPDPGVREGEREGGSGKGFSKIPKNPYEKNL